MIDFDFFAENIPFILSALPTTLKIIALSVLFASLLGAVLTYVRIRKTFVLYPVAEIIISFSRSVPVLVILYFLYYVFPYLGGESQSSGIPGVRTMTRTFSPDSIAIIGLTISFCAYFSEVFRAAYYSVEQGQKEAVLSVNLPPFTAFRRIILPQAFINALPNYTNVVIDVIKDSSLVFGITVIDLMAKANMAAARGFHFIEAYLVVLVIYIVFCLVLSKALRLVEVSLSKWRLS
jgi:L-cystine transport system permease protein